VLIVVELGALVVVVATGRRDLVGHPICSLLINAVPNHIGDLFVVHALENPVAPNQKEIEVVLYLERYDLRLAHDDVLIATVSGLLRFNVAESSRNGKPTRENS